MVYSRSDQVFDDMMTKTSSTDWAMLSKLLVLLNGLSDSMHSEPLGQRNPLPWLGPRTWPAEDK